MRSTSSYLVVIGLLATAACAASSNPVPTGSGGNGGGDQGNAQQQQEEDPNAPHALGQIVLGEAHSSAGTSTPLISASFYPDFGTAKAASKCTKTTTIAGCEVTKTATSTSYSCSTTCPTGTACGIDPDTCSAKCIPTCTKACASDETCSVSSGKAACVKTTSFDAGALAFGGLTSPMTLFPPYTVKPEGSGAPFLAKSEIHVQASGASEAGFAEFDEKFTATTFLETTPSISKLQMFGTTKTVTIGWKPGADDILITLSGVGGSAQCKGDDATGKFDLSRDVINAVMTSSSSSTSTTSGSLSLSVTRKRTETRKNKPTLGEIDGHAVDPGWLELTTMSTESATLQACATGETMCDGECVDLKTDTYNCGSCGRQCPSSYYCSYGSCTY